MKTQSRYRRNERRTSKDDKRMLLGMLLCFFLAISAGSAFSTQGSTGRPSSTTNLPATVNEQESGESPPHNNNLLGDKILNRRDTISASIAAMLLSSLPSSAATDDTITAAEVLQRLGNIPTFVLVQDDGVPFMIFNGERSATGFFFLSYNMAQTALQDALQKDAAKEAGAIWKAAQIRVIPLSVAMQLSLGPRERKAVNNDASIQGKTMNTYADIVMSEEGNIDAKRLDRERKNPNPQRWSNTKGRIPVFHLDGMKTKSGKDMWYFNLADLKADYKQQNNGEALLSNDKIELAEMMDLFRKASRKDDWSSLANVRFMPVPESKQVAVQVVKKQPEDDPYDFDNVFLVSSSK